MSSMPAYLKELLKNLEFLSMIQKNVKPCLSDMSFVESNSWSGAWKRSHNSESKKNLLNYMDSVVEQAFIAIQDPRNKEWVVNIIQSLSRAKVGISATETTYLDFPDYISSVRVLIKNIDHQLKKYELPDTNQV